MSVAMRTSEDLYEGQLDAGDLRAGSIPKSMASDPRRYSSGIFNVDESTGRWRPGEFICIGAREGEGKTVFLEKAALANSDEHRVLFASFDMARYEIRDRLLAKLMGTDAETVQRLAEEDSQGYRDAMSLLHQRDFMIWTPRDHSERTVQGITKYAEKVTAAILMIDYAALIGGWIPGSDARKIVTYLKDWAKDSLITTAMLAQLKDDAQNRRPNNADFQDTTAIRQRADRTILIYRPFRRKRHKDDVAEIITSKNRFGQESLNHAGWIGSTTDLYGLDAEAEAHARCCYRPPNK